MQAVLHAILTDTAARDPEQIQAQLDEQSAGAPWFD